MVNKTNECFPKDLRIRKRSLYLEVQKKGCKVQTRLFIGLFTCDQFSSKEARIGITTTKRFGNAVVRNRTRRLIREAFRKKLMRLPKGISLVVIPKRLVPTFESADIFEDLSYLGKKVLKHIEKKSD